MSCIERGEKEVISWGWSPSLAAKACCSGSVSLRAEPWTVLRFLYPLKTLHWQSHVYVCMCVCMPLRLAGTILCEPVGSSLPGSSVHDIFQARILEWISILSLGDLSDQASKPHLLCLLHWQADSLPVYDLAILMSISKSQWSPVRQARMSQRQMVARPFFLSVFHESCKY